MNEMSIPLSKANKLFFLSDLAVHSHGCSVVINLPKTDFYSITEVAKLKKNSVTLKHD